MSICDFLFSADMLVANPRDVVNRLISSIGLPPPGPAAYVEYRETGWDCVFALVNKAMVVGPTRLEVIGRPDEWHEAAQSHGQKIADLQGDRPAKTHATVIATPDLEAVGARLAERGVRHWYDTTKQPFDRIWLGVTQEEPAAYDPTSDGGVLLEIIPSHSAAFSPRLFATPAPQPDNPTPGQMIRIISRDFFVDDIDASLRALADDIGWEPEGSVRTERTGTRSVVLSRNYEQGATLKLVQPSPEDDAAGTYFARWGAGPHNIRIAVAGLDACAENLRNRGTAFVRLAADDDHPDRIQVDPEATGAMPFEFVELGSVTA